jgi:hypothetical protein
MRRVPRRPEPAQQWLAFLRNHREAIAAMDFFTVPTVTFKLLYCFFIIRHDRRQIVHMNVTRHPTSTWIVQQLREAFPYQSTPKFLLFDHDQKYGLEVSAAIRSMRITGVQTSIQSPWQNGVAERWVGSCRRDLLDHIIALNERQLKRILTDYVPCSFSRTTRWLAPSIRSRGMKTMPKRIMQFIVAQNTCERFVGRASRVGFRDRIPRIFQLRDSPPCTFSVCSLDCGEAQVRI